MGRRRSRLLVPEAREALDRLKCQVIREHFPEAAVNCSDQPDDVKYAVANQLDIPLAKGDNGELTTRQAGRVGGQMGGSMVRRLVEMAQQQLVEQQQGDQRS